MSTATAIVFSRENFHKIQQKLGKRPGDKYIDPFFLRRGLADRPYFWDENKKKWHLVSLGDVIHVEEGEFPWLEKKPR